MRTLRQEANITLARRLLGKKKERRKDFSGLRKLRKGWLFRERAG
jgi:hypothetical protein